MINTIRQTLLSLVGNLSWTTMPHTAENTLRTVKQSIMQQQIHREPKKDVFLEVSYSHLAVMTTWNCSLTPVQSFASSSSVDIDSYTISIMRAHTRTHTASTQG